MCHILMGLQIKTREADMEYVEEDFCAESRTCVVDIAALAVSTMARRA
jgi:hypothetical protein